MGTLATAKRVLPISKSCISTRTSLTIGRTQKSLPIACGCLQPHRRMPRQHRRTVTHSTIIDITPESDAPRDEDDGAQQSAEAAMQLLGDILEEVVQELFIDQGVAAVSDETPKVTESDVIQRVVSSRLDRMDNSFMAGLKAAIAMYTQQNEQGLVDLLSAIQNEVLKQVNELLPAPIRVLDEALNEREKVKRMEVLNAAVRPPLDNPPLCTVENLMVASSQLISDMEEQEEILDLRLLARLCLVREEATQIEEEMYLAGQLTEKHVFQRSNVPQRSIAFLKELLMVSSQLQRVALLDKTFLEDWQGAAPKNSNMKFMAGEDKAHLPDQVRPGRFLSTLATAYQALAQQGVADNEAVLKRMDAIKTEALAVLDKIQRS